MTQPLLVVVHGAAAAGKTLLSQSLAQALEMPLISTDDIKESLFDHFPHGTIAESDRISAASLDLLWIWLDRLMELGLVSLIVESVFPETTSEPRLGELLDLHGYRAVQIYCHATEPVLRERYVARARTPGRHPGHQDLRRVEGQPIPDHGPYRPLDLPGLLIDLDTTDLATVDYPAITRAIRDLM